MAWKHFIRNQYIYIGMSNIILHALNDFKHELPIQNIHRSLIN